MQRYITEDTYKKLKERLEVLKTQGRKEIADRIKIAKGFGDLSENAEYKEALEAQRQLEQRIFELENLLREAQIKRPSKSKNKIDIGVKFEVKDLNTKRKYVYILVGFGEANPLEGKISPESPLGSAFLGKKVDDVVTINLNGETSRYRVSRIL